MLVKVVKDFIDKNTREFHKVGDAIEVTEERASEILSAGKYIEVDESKAPALDKMKVDELKAFAAERNIDISEAKNKAEIIAIIEAKQ